MNVMKKEYDDLRSEHLRFKETLRKINQTYYWDQIKKKINKYV